MRSAVLSMTMLATGMPAMAQDARPLGSRLGAKEHVAADYDARDAAAGAHDLAQCLVHRRTESAVALLDATTPADADRADQALSREIECLQFSKTEFENGTFLNAPTPLFRGLIAEELIHQRYARKRAAALPVKRAYQPVWSAVDERPRVIDDMAMCVADMQPDGVEALLATAPATDGEAQAMAALVAPMGKCLAADAHLSGNRVSIRAALAEAMYHRLSGAPTPPVESK